VSASRYNGVGLQPKRHHQITILVTGVALGPIASFAYRHWANAPLSHVDVYDGFETQKLGRLWDPPPIELALRPCRLARGRGPRRSHRLT